MPSDSQLSLAHLIDAIAPDAKVVAGKEHAARPVSWVVTLAQPDRAVMPGDFAILLAPPSPDLIHSLSTRGAIGAAVLGLAPRGAIETAAANNLVLVELPKATD